MRNVFLTHELMHCISGLDKASLRPSAIFTFDIKSCQFLFVNFGSNVLLLVAGVGYLGINSIWPRGAPLQTYVWYIPSEKIGQNIDPLRNSFFVANYQHWTSTRALEPFLGPLDPWGALGGPWVVWGGLTTQKLPFSFRDQSKPWNGLFWLTITSYTMFLRFWVKMGPSGPKKGCFWPK